MDGMDDLGARTSVHIEGTVDMGDDGLYGPTVTITEHCEHGRRIYRIRPHGKRWNSFDGAHAWAEAFVERQFVAASTALVDELTTEIENFLNPGENGHAK